MSRGHRHGAKRPVPLVNVVPIVPIVQRQGIQRVGERAPAPRLPLTDRHREVQKLLRRKPRGATELAMMLGLRPQQVTSALYVLQSRGLAEHLPNSGGWVRPARQLLL
jgi:predicted Rossmann fold nucleotide-binding protein DprA/Smf involved in DNA uptake